MSRPRLPPLTPTEIGALIDTWLARSGLDLSEAAGLLGCSRSYLAQVRRGLRRPNAAMLLALARRTGTPLRDLAARVERDRAAVRDARRQAERGGVQVGATTD